MRINKKSGRFYADARAGETPRLVLAALAMAEAALAQSEDEGARYTDVLFHEVQQFISADDRILDMPKFRRTICNLRVDRQELCTDGRDAYQIDLTVYPHDPILLIKLADVVIEVFVSRTSDIRLNAEEVDTR